MAPGRTIPAVPKHGSPLPCPGGKRSAQKGRGKKGGAFILADEPSAPRPGQASSETKHEALIEPWGLGTTQGSALRLPIVSTPRLCDVRMRCYGAATKDPNPAAHRHPRRGDSHSPTAPGIRMPRGSLSASPRLRARNQTARYIRQGCAHRRSAHRYLPALRRAHPGPATPHQHLKSRHSGPSRAAHLHPEEELASAIGLNRCTLRNPATAAARNKLLFGESSPPAHRGSSPCWGPRRRGRHRPSVPWRGLGPQMLQNIYIDVRPVYIVDTNKAA